MKKLLYGLAIIVFAACSTDGLVPCEKEGTQGELCREYRYLNDSPKGYVAFEQQGDSLQISDYYSESLKLIKTIRQQFEHGRIIVISEQYPNEDSRIQTWHYNETDSLERIVFGPNDSAVHIDYAQEKRHLESYFRGAELDRYFEYRYYQDDGKLYRIYAYNAMDSLLSYRQFDYFSTGQNRVSFYTSEHKLMGRRVYNSQNGVINSVQFTDTTGTVTERTDYLYDATLNLTEKVERKGDQNFKSVFIYY
ncbi:MAG: hypothetical protein K9G41_10220 [Flavobacteriales bacterium]|nr:hypothetical protein [Flavobacteriales bacterium]